MYKTGDVIRYQTSFNDFVGVIVRTTREEIEEHHSDNEALMNDNWDGRWVIDRPGKGTFENDACHQDKFIKLNQKETEEFYKEYPEMEKYREDRPSLKLF